MSEVKQKEWVIENTTEADRTVLVDNWPTNNFLKSFDAVLCL